jgi:molybdopterin-guanine dinucleotide biosynthesis protein A
MGRPKATVELDGVPLWKRAIDCLIPFVVETILLGTVPGLVVPEGHRQLADNPMGIGPLGGLVTGLEQSGHEHHLLLAVDYPLVPPVFFQALLAQAERFHAVCGQGDVFLEPLVGYYHRDCAPVIRKMIAQGEIRTHKLYERVPSRVISPVEMLKIDPAKWAHFNVNTPADLIRAERRLRAGYPQ